MLAEKEAKPSQAEPSRADDIANWLDLLPTEVLSHIWSFLAKSELLICISASSFPSFPSVEYLAETEWKQLPNMLSERYAFSAVQMENVIYVVGGNDAIYPISQPHSTMESFDFQLPNWRREQPQRQQRRMNTSLEHCAAAVVQLGEVQMIVVCGGLEEDREQYCTVLQTVQLFNAQQRTWRGVENMRETRYKHCAVTLKEQVVVLGGLDGNMKTVSSCEKYSPLQNIWHPFPNMLVPRQAAAATVANNKIFIAGGFDGKARLASVEVFNPSNGIWVNVSKMNSIRFGLGLATFGDKIVALGGYDEEALLKSVEVYDIEKDAWTDGPVMSTPKFYPALLTVKVDKKLCHKSLFK